MTNNIILYVNMISFMELYSNLDWYVKENMRDDEWYQCNAYAIISRVYFS